MDPRFRHGVGDDNLLRVLKAMENNLERPPPRARLAKTRSRPDLPRGVSFPAPTAGEFGRAPSAVRATR